MTNDNHANTYGLARYIKVNSTMLEILQRIYYYYYIVLSTELKLSIICTNLQC